VEQEHPTQFPLLSVVHDLAYVAMVYSDFIEGEHFHLKLTREPYEPLVIEAWDAHPSYLGEKRHISVAHYREENGDLIADSDILMTGIGLPIYIQQILGYTEVIREGEDNTTVIDRSALRSVLGFMRLWASNIRAQGWLAAAVEQNAHHTKNEIDRHTKQ
jgi:hypothetical protein